MLKLLHSGRTLEEAKSMMKATTVALTDEYTQSKDKSDLLKLEGGLHRLAMTRNEAKQLMKIKFEPRRSYPATREEAISKWVNNYQGQIPLSWERDGNLIRRGQPNKSRPGSSEGKIGVTNVIGAAKVLKSFSFLVKTLQDIMLKDSNADTTGLKEAFRSVRTQVRANII